MNVSTITSEVEVSLPGLPSFTEFYRVLPSFSGFYLVLPGFHRIRFCVDSDAARGEWTPWGEGGGLPSFTELFSLGETGWNGKKRGGRCCCLENEWNFMPEAV